MSYTVISIICIVILATIAIGYTLAGCKKERSQRIKFIRSFKKGKCFVVYLAAIPLYWIGFAYGGNGIFQSFFPAVNKSMGLIALGYDTGSVSKLMADNAVYTFAIYFCFVLVTLNAIMFAVSLMQQRIWAFFQSIYWRFTRKERLLIVGNNDANLDIYSSEDKRVAILTDDLSDKDKEALYLKKIRFLSKSFTSYDLRKGEFANGIEKVCFELISCCLSQKSRSCIIIINTKDDDKNISLCHKIVEFTHEHLSGKDPSVISDLLSRIRVYVFGMPAYETIYDGIVGASNGCVRYVNKYRQVAMDFINRFPLTQFMTSEQIDYETSLLKDGVDVNVAMIGFGKTSRQIFLTSVANNQFLTLRDGKVAIKQVHYHVFDKLQTESNKNLNHGYFRFKNEFKSIENNSSSYLPLPDLPADVHHHSRFDVNDPEFYQSVKETLSGKKKFNYIIIAFGTDLENIDMAQKLLEKKQEWALYDTYVFVNVRRGNRAFDIFKRNDCFMIGDEKNTVYSIQKIDDHIMTSMAMMRNRIYKLEGKAKSSPDIKKIYDNADRDWYIKKTQFERESNIYACLSLRAKLHLMGLDYLPCDENEASAMDNDAYLDRYAKDDLPKYEKNITANGKKIVEYGIDFAESRRKTMAIHEHLRWNSFMLSKGFVPASKEEIMEDTENNGKDYCLRKHGNLTTFDGLLEFRRMVALRDNKSEEDTDVIKYDYQLLDDAHWLLSKNGFKIIDRSI